MDDLTTDLWLRTGAALVWDADALAAVATGCTVSLRAALSWLPRLPAEPPGDAPAVVVTGLHTALDVLPAAAAQRILAQTRLLVREHSRRWGEAALIFALRAGAVSTTSDGAIMLTLPDGRTIDLGTALWGGAATDAAFLLLPRPDPKGKPTPLPIGYWLRRVS